MCGGSRRRAQRMAAMNSMGAGYGLMGGARSCNHACTYGCQSGCGHPCQQRGCYPGYQRGYGSCGSMGMYNGYRGGCCGRNGGLIMGVVVPLVKKAIDKHNEKKALELGQIQSQQPRKPEISTTRSTTPQENGVIGGRAGSYKDEKARSRKNSTEKDLDLVKPDEQPPAYTPEDSSPEQSPFLSKAELQAQGNLPHDMPQNPVIERLVTDLTKAIRAHHTNRQCGTKKAIRQAKKALRNELEEIEEARKGASLSCSEWKVLKTQVDDLVAQIEVAIGARH